MCCMTKAIFSDEKYHPRTSVKSVCVLGVLVFPHLMDINPSQGAPGQSVLQPVCVSYALAV